MRIDHFQINTHYRFLNKLLIRRKLQISCLISTLYKTESEQNRCAMTCRGCGAVCFFTLKMAVTGLSQDSIVKVRPITNFTHGLSPNNCL